MANLDIPTGLIPRKLFGGGDLDSVELKWCKHLATNATAIGKYDAVKIVDAGTDAVYQEVVQATAGAQIHGVAVAFRTDAPDGPITLAGANDIPRYEYCPASTLMYIGVLADPRVIYEVQEDSDGVNLAAGNLMSCADLVVAAVNTTTGLSQMELDSSTVTAADSGASSAQLQILGLAPATEPNGNAVGTNANWLVRIVEHDFNTPAVTLY